MEWLIIFGCVMIGLAIYVRTIPDCRENWKFEYEESERRMQELKSKLSEWG